MLLDIAGILYAFRKVYVAEIEVVRMRAYAMPHERGDWLAQRRFRHYVRNVWMVNRLFRV